MNNITRKESLVIILGSFVAAFVLSFRNWGEESLDIAIGLTSFIISVIVILIIVLTRVTVQKWLARRLRYQSNYEHHKWGLGLSVFLAFYTSGFVTYLVPGVIKSDRTARQGIGAHRPGVNFGDLAKITMIGALATMLLVSIIKPFVFLFPNSFLLYKFVQASAAIAISALIPLPSSEGFWLIYHRRWLWIFTFIFVIIFFVLVLQAHIFSYALSLVIAILFTYVFKKYVD
jgi:hypothetical protein